MKKILFAAVALLGVLFTGCSTEDDNVTNEKRYEGMWVLVAEEYEGDYEEYYDDVDSIISIENNEIKIYLNDDGGYTYKNGYLHDCYLDCFEYDTETHLTIVDDNITLMGIPVMKISKEGDRLVFTTHFTLTASATYYWEELKGFK